MEINKDPKWISVSDRLPEIGEDVLICLMDYVEGPVLAVAELTNDPRNGPWCLGQGVRTFLGDCEPYIDDTKSVTHWMPLPKSPW